MTWIQPICASKATPNKESDPREAGFFISLYSGMLHLEHSCFTSEKEIDNEKRIC